MYATYTSPNGEKMIVNILGVDESQCLALLSYQEPASGEHRIWIASRDQNGSPGSWLWTTQQQADARYNQIRIIDAENDFPFEKELESGMRPGAQTAAEKRKIEIIKIGYELGKSRAEIEDQLRREGLDPFWPGQDNEAAWMAAYHARIARS